MGNIAKWQGKLTEHFDISEYMGKQTGTIYLTKEAYEHAQILEEMRKWYGMPIKVNSWFRTKEYNDKLIAQGKHASKTSNHLRGCATDVNIYFDNEKEFLKFAQKWKALCKAHGTVGEIGTYKIGRFIHLGSHITYSKTFYHWMTDAKGQHNMYYGDKI